MTQSEKNLALTEATQIYDKFYKLTPEILAWGTRHNLAKDCASIYINGMIKKYEDDLCFAGCLNDAKEMAIQLNNWKATLKELDTIK
jgi:hypothetical protein